MEQEKNLNSAQKVVSLAEALRSKKEAKKSREEQDVTFERIDAIMTDLRNKIAFWRAYPDLFVDLIKGKDCTFKFYFYQRVFLRAAMRYRYVYATYPRAFSKSFLSMMVLMLRCVLYPGSHLFVTTGGKEQAASITISKVEEICKLIPALHREINWNRGASRKSKDNVEYKFFNNSVIDILPARETSRGQRRTAGLMEECVLIDKDALNDIIIPTTNVDRLLPDGKRYPEEVINKSQIYITTAGYKNSFAYEKLRELMIQAVLEGDACAMGGTYKVPVKEGLLSKNFVNQLKMAGTYDANSFEREYCSVWSGDSENSYYSSEAFDKCRKILQPELSFSNRSSKNAYYVLGVDVGRKGCSTEVAIIKVTPQVQGASLKSLVNFVPIENDPFEIQALKIRKLFALYKAKTLVVDANGIGISLVDELIKGQNDPETNEYLPPLGVINDDEGFYKKYKTADTIKDVLYLIKANSQINTEAHAYVQAQISSGKMNFLITAREAKIKLLSTKVGMEMAPSQRNEKLFPYVQTDILKEQMMNLAEDHEGTNIILKQVSRGIPKDKFSAFEYGMLYIKRREESKKSKGGRRVLVFCN